MARRPEEGPEDGLCPRCSEVVVVEGEVKGGEDIVIDGSRLERWLFNGLHSLDFAFLVRTTATMGHRSHRSHVRRGPQWTGQIRPFVDG